MDVVLILAFGRRRDSRLRLWWSGNVIVTQLDVMASVTRSGNLLDFEQLFKAFGNN